MHGQTPSGRITFGWQNRSRQSPASADAFAWEGMTFLFQIFAGDSLAAALF
jgi:hypothetical protein